jgi:hypothetical protein
MKRFQEFILEQGQLDERFARKGAVGAYALQSKRHGDAAIKDYNSAKQALRSIATKSSQDDKLNTIILALIDLMDGLSSQRQQIGSLSAQVTALSLL